MPAVALVLHQLRPQAGELARVAVDWLARRGLEARIPEDDAKVTGLPEWACPPDALASGGLELAVSLGGDGTMLRTVELVAAAGVPVLGVNVGHLGYLTEVEPPDLVGALERFFAGDHEVEERMTLEVEADQGGRRTVHLALNEAVLERAGGHSVRLAACISDRRFTTYAADALIVATPTGSTAYNLSARGPILSPRMRAMVLTAVSPHMLFDRSLVLDAAEPVRLEVIDGRSATLVVDGRPVGTLATGDGVLCRPGPYPARLVSFGGRDFFRILKTKFGLADR